MIPKPRMSRTAYGLLFIYVALIPALIFLAVQFAKVRDQNITHESHITRLTNRLHRAERFREECPCCYVMPINPDTVPR
jgi:hypothetical protein